MYRRLQMPLIQVQMFAGRTPQQKRDLVRALTDAFVETAGSTPDSVDIILTDVEQSDWAQGGELFSEKQSK
ncbi:MAG: 4-oxalocrotonate tautomerase [Arenicellales bacterium]